MAVSPPGSPTGAPQRPFSGIMRTPRSNSRLSMSSKLGGGSRASDEDGKTAVKVAVRVRPPLKPTDPGYELVPKRFQRSMVHVMSPTNLAVDVPQGRKLFVFDRVFPETTDQDGIWEYLSDSVSSFLQGYNVSILAYGQSGAGKSYTMGTSGPSEQHDTQSMGIIPRAAQLLFEKLEGPTKHNRNSSTGLRTPTRYSISSTSSFGKANADKTWQLKASYVEIYNEQLRDLLLPDSTPMADRNAVTIREDTKGRIILTGLHQVNINSFEDLMNALSFGSSIRQTDSTAINAKSSRSHAVFSLNLVRRKSPGSISTPKEKRMSMPVEVLSGSDASVTVDSKLHFVDLAGSERLKNTGASGERAREGISINAGLAALGKVISQLSSRQAGAHVSYRDSKLTRLLQDSLGGSAYTYMVACVTPAEFHLSETLNTVQYAQRARAIQSKPQIQHISDDSDKHAVIERLKAEVAFLRQQLRNAEDNERRSVAPQERAERQNEREMELHNQLLDVQESYNALSQRHAKLIAELARDSEHHPNGDADDVASAVGKSSVERLKRSHSFAESVEQVVLEYEKTIQSLESSLSNTRSSLSVTESTLLERETKCAYVETVNAQLQTRLQKLMDREASTESYLHELESRLDGQSSGEEKYTAIIAELRKELSRARESEAGCEDYISTLEERLAEADQDMELMQREVERLEHVVERQRSLGKLDSLLHELDHVHQNGVKQKEIEGLNESPVPAVKSARNSRQRAMTLEVLTEAAETAIPESDEDLAERVPGIDDETISEMEPLAEVDDGSDLEVLEKATSRIEVDSDDESRAPSPSLTESKIVADKLDTVSQELFDLRLQHENTLTQYELLEAKYEEALKALAGLEREAVDEALDATVPAQGPASTTTASRPVSFLEDAKAPDSKSGKQRSFSQSLSSELSLVGESAASLEPSNGPSEPSSEDHVDSQASRSEKNSREMEHMRQLLNEHQEGVSIMTQKYAELRSEHEDALTLVESLKAELRNSKSTSTPTTPNFKSNVIRRKTSQSLISTVDRAHRSLAALRNIAVEEFAGRTDTMQNFEVHLDSAMHELHSRMERIQSLEAENQSVKKEMETKATIISGLTRERSSLQGGTPSADMGLMSQLRDQVVQQEGLINDLKEAHEAREKLLLEEIEELKDLLKTQEAAAKAQDAHVEEQDKKIGVLEGELTEWKSKHQNAVESLQASEQQLTATLAELDSALATIDTIRTDRAAADETTAAKEATARELEGERIEQQRLVESLKRTIEEHESTAATRLEQIASLEQLHKTAQGQLSELLATKGNDGREVEGFQSRISELEREIQNHKSTSDSHKKDVEILQDSHKKELAELEARATAAAQAEYNARIAEEGAEHEAAMNKLRAEIVESREELARLLEKVSALVKSDITADNLEDQIQDILTQKQHFSDKYAELMDANEDLRKQLEAKSRDADKLQELTKREAAKEAKVNELAILVATLEDTLQRKDEQVKKKEALIDEITVEKEKSLRLVEELEEQITNSFDQHHNRLSVIQQERDQALEDAKGKIVTYEKEIETYQVRIEQLELQIKNSTSQDGSHDRSSSLTSNLRKSASAASLPSPPPAIPLPPLPTIPSGTNGGVSPPSSRHTSKELVSVQMVEESEARIRTIEKHLNAEKQLTATLEEALGDLEAQSNKVKTDCEAWKKKAWQLEEELTTLRKERNSQRLSLQAVEEERNARREAEAARAQLEERMNALNKKKKKSTLNCF
ncbi:kinesin family protein [Aspergillus clavatus NRRL 1]|uniref:Kinesin family protein n=1 Tax=Aspergillus clavatus (strain ATCC 1007 / CBS 513.65 / DSM 816 / NCTC 3887 / NRRL 1 / QM 1276 / 107) TaxID=344612 RepID=A1CBQ3_ASPCL|nr:kinesin family protein [Aspergillus clavatus NRRL 1]EAW13171.1 kinesin family protein [Aspergillus clavatus NRRL 1]